MQPSDSMPIFCALLAVGSVGVLILLFKRAVDDENTRILKQDSKERASEPVKAGAH